MDENRDIFDDLISESMLPGTEEAYPSYLTDKILGKITRRKLWINILSEFGIKAISVFLLLTIFPLIILVVDTTDLPVWKTFFNSNITVILAVLLMIYVIFFLNEVIEKLLSIKKARTLIKP